MQEIDELNCEILNKVSLPKTNPNTAMPPIIDGFLFRHLWVHFGLNASDHDAEDIKDCFIQSIEHLNDNTKEFQKMKSRFRKKGIIYDTYFSKPIIFYASNGWYPIWQHPHFFNIFPNYYKELSSIPEAINFISKHQMTLDDRYVIFSDLIFIRDRLSKNIKKILILDELKDSIWNSWINQMEYYKPTGATIANAQAQEFVKNQLLGEKYSYLIDYNSIPVILSSQFSGGSLSNPLYGLLRDLFKQVSYSKPKGNF